VWKSLHMMVYVAYASIVLHVAFGVLQYETHPALVVLLAAGMAWLLTIHGVAGWRERAGDKPLQGARAADGFLAVCAVSEIPEKRAKVVSIAGERVAVYKYEGTVSALSSVCKHQNGPLGEGKIVDGCVVCPWHGFQYRPADGKAPPPFVEKVATFNVRVNQGHVFIDPRPNAPGTYVTPARIDGVGNGPGAAAGADTGDRGGVHA
jgi:nitrite reductase/ring-hydroxylating ferredoxin subunit